MRSKSTERNSETGSELKVQNSGKYEDYFFDYSDVETESKSDSSPATEASSGVHRTSGDPSEVESNHDNQRTSESSRSDEVG